MFTSLGKARPFLAAIVLALSTGCAVLEPASAPPRPAREAIAAFRIEGRIAVHHANENFSAGIDWRHDAQSDEMLISGPLGQGLARLSARPGAALLETSGQQQYAAENLEDLSAQVFGIRLPVSGLERWVLGHAISGDAVSIDATGRLTALSEQGWMVEYLRYESDAPDALPALLRAQREDIEVRLVIDNWTVSE